MSDGGTRATEAAVKRTEARLKAVYQQASDEVEASMWEWQKRHAQREARYQAMVDRGTMSQADFDAWKRGQLFHSRQWLARQAQIDEILMSADKEAARIVNQGKLGVFASNANYTGYQIEHDLNVDTGFTLYDEQTVIRLINEDPQILPMPRPGVQKPLAYPYYNKLMTSAITQGIVQGETIPEIARRVARTTGEASYKSALRNARTAYTGAQNAGRIEGMHQAQKLGIDVKKQWMATLDGRTRDAHRDMDGQTRDVDEPFESDLGKIMFPGDPTAHPANVYNCRCTLIHVYPKYKEGVGVMELPDGTKVLVKTQLSGPPRRAADTGEVVGDMTYREWEAWKQAGKPPITVKSPMPPAAQTAQAAPAKFQQYTETAHDEQYRKLRSEHDQEEKKAYEADQRGRRLPTGDARDAAFAERDAHLARVSQLDDELMKYRFEATAKMAKDQGVAYVPLKKNAGNLSEDDIISRLAGGDMTGGSCASLSYCFIGQKAGYDVLDFRGGDSCHLIASNNKVMLNSLYISGYDSIQGVAKNYKTAGKRALKQAEIGKEYMFSCGRHAAIVRRTGKDDYEYLELQSSMKNGWMPFGTSDMDRVLKYRFGADIGGFGDVKSTLVSVDQMSKDDRILKIMGYINTPESQQLKGSSGHER